VLIRHPGGRPACRPGVLAVAVVTLAIAAACSHTSAVPDVVQPQWRQSGELSIRFTVYKPRAATVRVQAVLTVDNGGRVRAMHTVQSSDGVVTSRTDWTGGPTMATAHFPGCATADEPANPPDDIAGWLAEPFGPVNAATADGWTIETATATRPGSRAETVERASLTTLPARTVREVDRASGAIVTETRDISIFHAASTAPLPPCGAPWTE
jgi:hypothetical protein